MTATVLHKRGIVSLALAVWLAAAAAGQYVYTGPGTAFWYRVNTPGLYRYNTGAFLGSRPFTSGEVYGVTPFSPLSQVYVGPPVAMGPLATPQRYGYRVQPYGYQTMPYAYGPYAPYGYQTPLHAYGPYAPYGYQTPLSASEIDGADGTNPAGPYTGSAQQGYQPTGQAPHFADPYAPRPLAQQPVGEQAADAGEQGAAAPPAEDTPSKKPRRRRVATQGYGYLPTSNSLITPHRLKRIQAEAEAEKAKTRPVEAVKDPNNAAPHKPATE